MKIFSVLKGLNIIDCCEDFVISATTEEVCTIYFALRCVEEFHADQVDTQKTKELIETIKGDYFRRSDAEVHKPDYRYESELMKRSDQ